MQVPFSLDWAFAVLGGCSLKKDRVPLYQIELMFLKHGPKFKPAKHQTAEHLKQLELEINLCFHEYVHISFP